MKIEQFISEISRFAAIAPDAKVLINGEYEVNEVSYHVPNHPEVHIVTDKIVDREEDIEIMVEERDEYQRMVTKLRNQVSDYRVDINYLENKLLAMKAKEKEAEGMKSTVDESMLQNAYSVGYNAAVDKYGNVDEITKLRQEHDVTRIAVAELLRHWYKGAEKGELYHAIRKIEEACEL